MGFEFWGVWGWGGGWVGGGHPDGCRLCRILWARVVRAGVSCVWSHYTNASAECVCILPLPLPFLSRNRSFKTLSPRRSLPFHKKRRANRTLARNHQSPVGEGAKVGGPQSRLGIQQGRQAEQEETSCAEVIVAVAT